MNKVTQPKQKSNRIHPLVSAKARIVLLLPQPHNTLRVYKLP